MDNLPRQMAFSCKYSKSRRTTGLVVSDRGWRTFYYNSLKSVSTLAGLAPSRVARIKTNSLDWSLFDEMFSDTTGFPVRNILLLH